MKRRDAAARPTTSLAACDWLVAALTIAVIGLFGMLAAVDWSARVRAVERQGERTAETAAASLRDALGRQERILEALTDRASSEAEPNRAALEQLVAALPSLDPDLRGAAVLDDEGSVVARAAPGIDASVFTRLSVESTGALAAQHAPALYVTHAVEDPAVENPAGGGEIVGLARARHDSEGRYAGLVLLAVDRSWFDRLSRSTAAPANQFDILRGDQAPLFFTPKTAMSSEEVPVLSHLEPVTKFPILLRYRQPIGDLYAAWRTAWIGNGILLAFGMTAMVAAMALRQRRQRRATLLAIRGRIRKTLTLRKTLGEFAAAAKRADEASRTKSRFLALVTHELRSPLNAILGFSEVIQRELFGPAGDPRYTKFAGHVHEAGIHLLSLIDDLLDMAKIEAGRMDIAPIRVSAPALARSALDIVGLSAQHRDISLSVNGEETCPDLFIDLRAGKQVLINLLSNAIKFSPRGGRIELQFVGTADGGVAITVADSGVGMSAEEIGIAFEPFGRVAKGDAGEPGTGLGLPLARALVRLHGGELSLDSQPGRGDTRGAVGAFLRADRQVHAVSQVVAVIERRIIVVVNILGQHVLPLLRHHLQQHLAAEADVTELVALLVDRLLCRVFGFPGAAIDLAFIVVRRAQERVFQHRKDAGVLEAGHEPVCVQPVADEDDAAGLLVH
jgi:signal transduction histidine kinase